MATVIKPPTLVVLQLTGGNDPLNTVIPYGDPHYYDNRPTVRIPEQDILPIDNHYGFHPSMAAIKPFWDDGNMAILTGIGNPNVDYSHFRSMDIWYTCEPETMATDGWLGKVVREMDPKADNVLTAVNFGRGLPRAFTLDGVPVASVAELDSYGLLTGLSSVAERAIGVRGLLLHVRRWLERHGPSSGGVAAPARRVGRRRAALHGPNQVSMRRRAPTSCGRRVDGYGSQRSPIRHPRSRRA